MNLLGPDKHENVWLGIIYLSFIFACTEQSLPVTLIRQRGLRKATEFPSKKEIMHNYLDGLGALRARFCHHGVIVAAVMLIKFLQQCVILLWRPGPAGFTSNQEMPAALTPTPLQLKSRTKYRPAGE